ncbi:hypothetical protein ACO0QE_001847 [Hanseniaspora vineae]
MSFPIITFKAGVCDFDEETQTITPVAMGGSITISQIKEDTEDENNAQEDVAMNDAADEDEEEEEDMLIYEFVWKPTESSAKAREPDSYTIIPGENVWKHIESCKDGRVFALVFSSGEKKFFWLQDKVEDGYPKNHLSKQDLKNEEIVQKIMKGL